MSKFFQAFLTGLFFMFILDFLVILGIKINYIDFYEVGLYYNAFFADNQNGLIFFASSLLLGYILIYIDNNILSTTLLVLLFSLATLTFVKSIGQSAGAFLLMKKNITLFQDKKTYVGDVYYEGRTTITFYDYRLEKMIVLEKTN